MENVLFWPQNWWVVQFGGQHNSQVRRMRVLWFNLEEGCKMLLKSQGLGKERNSQGDEIISKSWLVTCMDKEKWERLRKHLGDLWEVIRCSVREHVDFEIAGAAVALEVQSCFYCKSWQQNLTWISVKLFIILPRTECTCSL